MLNKLIPFSNNQYKAINILIVEHSNFRRAFLTNAIAKTRPYHNIIAVDSIEEVFSLMYGEVHIDSILFDIEPLFDVNNISIINAISPEIAFIHWSDCQHPEIIELLHGLGVNAFCLKDSNLLTLVSAIDSIATNPQILYVDERLNQCLPLLVS
ncbi:Response regulator containing a CheY-like receiver domain and an HTH DNA-binding domain [Hyella patelloides LEGE 07179]|uniref:Response regulator containing a CheY-like receiver domain and an HTH DNA-binding domain n=2 Tax=Hyella TaxID=945733 RepID=A0A563VUZ2_9CYAN|nr:Response regulator containing a CheY-like receiver domain and an HTH DNA-binding domain [Hyella patelloides LEGE 07179]